MISNKHRNVYSTLNYIEHLIILASVMKCVSIFAFASVAGIPLGIVSSAVGIKIYAITAVIKKHNTIIEKKRENTIK